MYLCHCQNINTQPAIKAATTKNDTAQRTPRTQVDTPYLGKIKQVVLESKMERPLFKTSDLMRYSDLDTYLSFETYKPWHIEQKSKYEISIMAISGEGWDDITKIPFATGDWSYKTSSGWTKYGTTCTSAECLWACRNILERGIPPLQRQLW